MVLSKIIFYLLQDGCVLYTDTLTPSLVLLSWGTGHFDIVIQKMLLGGLLRGAVAEDT